MTIKDRMPRRVGTGWWLLRRLIWQILITTPIILYGQETPQSVAQILNEAERLEERGNRSGARSLYERVIQLDERQTSAYLGLSRIAQANRAWAEMGDWTDKALKYAPGDTAAHYLRAIAFRERARYRLLLQHYHWRSAEEHFNWILVRDSLYRDVLYQYALLKQYHGDYAEALRLAHTQLRLKPKLSLAHAEIFDLYRSFIRHTQKDTAIAWLKSYPSDHTAFFLGEILRRNGDFSAAEAIFSGILNESLNISRIPILLSTARVKYALEKPEEAQAFIEQAIQEIKNPNDAGFILDDIKYIMTDEEWQIYQTQQTPADYRLFFRNFWLWRDPMPAHDINVRIQEHYRRLGVAERDYVFDGIRFWFNDPDKLGQLQLPATYYLNQEFNDKGLIYIRHGAPTEHAIALGENVQLNESWRYRHMKMDLHFVVDEGGTGNNWRLTSRLDDEHMLRSRESWGGIYLKILYAHSTLERERNLIEMASQTNEAVTRALSTDSQTWQDDVRALDFKYQVAAFRGEGRQTRVVIYTGFPNENTVSALDSEIPLEVGFAVFDQEGATIERHKDTLGVNSTMWQGGIAIDSTQIVVDPGRYNVALHIRQIDGEMLGGYRFVYEAPDFSRPGLKMSDMLLFQSESHPFISPTLSRKKPLHIYFEIYDLASGENEQTQYTVAYTLIPKEGRRKFMGLAGPVVFRAAISLEAQHIGTGPTTREVTELDIAEVDPGAYTLTLKVTDVRTGGWVECSQSLEINP